MEDAIEQSFKISLGVLRLFGVYSFEKSSPLMKLFILIPYFQGVSVVFLGFINLLEQKQRNLMELTMLFLFLIGATNFCVRCALFFKFSERIKCCVKYFRHRRFQPKDDKEKCMVENCVRICQMICRIFAIAVLVSATGWCLQPILKEKTTLTVDIWLPFDFSSSYLLYCGSSLYVDAACFYLGFISSCMDPLLGGLIHHATTQLEILKYNLMNFHKLNDIKSKVKFEAVAKFLYRCVEHHNAILEFVTYFEHCFSWIIFSQIAASTLSLCFCCIGMTMVDVKSLDFFEFFSIYCVTLSQIVFYCFYGTLLLEESKSLNEAVYLGPWYSSDVRTRKVLIVLMERAKRPMVITSGRIFELTLETLKAVIKTSYSLIAVLKNIGAD